MQIDHIRPVYTETDLHKKMSLDDANSVDNLLPACRSCNLYKSTMPLEKFRQNLTEKMLQTLQQDFRYKMLLQYGIIQESVHPIKFYYEGINKNTKVLHENVS